jgi:hypothetical protein
MWPPLSIDCEFTAGAARGGSWSQEFTPDLRPRPQSAYGSRIGTGLGAPPPGGRTTGRGPTDSARHSFAAEG